MFLKVLIVLLTTYIALSLPSNKTVKGLQAGHFVFQQTIEQKSHLFMFKFQTSFPEVPQLAIGIDGFKMNTGVLSNNFDLSIQVVTQTGVIVKWKRSIQKWIHVSINYFSSIRPDMILGFSQINLGQKNEIIHEVIFSKPIPHQSSCIARMYLTGCCTDASLFDCKIVGKQFTQSSLSITASIGSQSRILSSANITFSYIIFSPAKASFSSFGGMIDQHNFKGLYHTNVRKVIYKTDYFLYGFSMLTFKAQHGQHIHTTIDGDQVMTIQAERQISFRLVYIAVGKSSKESCKNVPYTYQWHNQCVVSCPGGTYPHKYANGGLSCLSCPAKLNMLLGQGKCSCRQGFVMENNQCLPNLLVQQVHKKQENKKNVKQEVKKSAKGLKNLMQLFNIMQNNTPKDNSIEQSTQDSRKETQVHKNKAISHIPNIVDNHNKQNAIHPVSTSSPITQSNPVYQQQTIVSTSQPSIIPTIKADCGCNKLEADIPVGPNGCGPNAYMLGGICFCKPGFKKVNGQCVASQTMEVIKPLVAQASPQISTHSSSCDCSSGSCENACTSSVNYKNSCSENSCKVSINDNSCSSSLCSGVNCGVFVSPNKNKHQNHYQGSKNDHSYDNQGYDYQAKHPNEGYNGQSKHGTGYGSGCGSGYGSGCGNGHGNSGEGYSPCIPPAQIGSDGQCYCPQGQVLSNNQCFQCTYPAVFDYSTSACQHFCGQNAEYLEGRKECVCKEGFGVGKDGKCQVCEGQTYLYKGYCVECGDGMVYDTETKKCVCPKGTLMNNDCECISRCGQFEIYNQTTQSCICMPRFGRHGGKCKLCDQDQVVNKKGICSRCGRGFRSRLTFRRGQCVCKRQYAIIQGACWNCRSILNSFYNNRRKCVLCPLGLTYNGQTRSCQAPQTNTPQEQTSSPEVGNPQESKKIQNDVTSAIKTGDDVKAICGNGMIEDFEECDDRNTDNGDGCSSQCKVQPGYECKRIPSQCQKLPNWKELQESAPKNIGNQKKADTPEVKNKDLLLEGKILGNSNQIFLTLNTVKAFDFPNQEVMKNFIKVKFEGCSPPSMFCGQKDAPDKNLFDCLLLFPSGIPLSVFKAKFSYSYKGSEGWADVDINPLDIRASNNRRYSRHRRNSNIP